MNLHKAKGLQAPVVFLAGPRTSSSGVIDSFIDRSSDQVRGYLAVTTKKGFATITHATPEGWVDLKEQEKLFRDAEKTRLIYVAVTRAESMLVVSQDDSGKSKCIWLDLSPWLAGVDALTMPGMPEARNVRGVIVTQKDVREAASAVDGRLRAVEAPTFSVRAAKEYALSGDFAATPLTLMSFAEPDPGTTARVPEGEHGVEWGAAVHQVLELAMKDSDADLEASALEALDDAGIDRGRTGDLVDTVRAVKGSEIWQRARGSKRRLSEAPFEVLNDIQDEGEADTVPTLVRGSIDLAFLEDDGWVIVDYKADSAPLAGDYTDLAATYAPQVELYARAFEGCTGQKVKRTALYFIRTNTLIELPSA
jgi:ATP-dependent helicase/nuclease subunit A